MVYIRTRELRNEEENKNKKKKKKKKMLNNLKYINKKRLIQELRALICFMSTLQWKFHVFFVFLFFWIDVLTAELW